MKYIDRQLLKIVDSLNVKNANRKIGFELNLPAAWLQYMDIPNKIEQPR